ncbi:hypothetical protein [Sorangium sp. So ce693]|uniref:hypothetical protein n=1 Tax=Sorangium sp. So ce693 TaxID=3133318 RepID=UPI003F5D90D5
MLRGAIQHLDTANLWFGEGKRTGAYQVRPIDQVIKASRPWRARLKAFADQALAFEPDLAEQFADVNTSGTLTEETSDLAMLLRLAQQHQARLSPVGLTEDFLREGSALLDEVSGRDLLGILGLRNRDSAWARRGRERRGDRPCAEGACRERARWKRPAAARGLATPRDGGRPASHARRAAAASLCGRSAPITRRTVARGGRRPNAALAISGEVRASSPAPRPLHCLVGRPPGHRYAERSKRGLWRCLLQGVETP